MAILDEEELDLLVREAIIDRLEAWELVEFLDISTERIVELLTEEILENLNDVKELVGLEIDDEPDE